MKTRANLQRQAEQFTALAENIPQLAWLADAKGSIYWYNKRWFDYTGTDLEAMQGWGWTSVHHPDHVSDPGTMASHGKTPSPFAD